MVLTISGSENSSYNSVLYFTCQNQWTKLQGEEKIDRMTNSTALLQCRWYKKLKPLVTGKSENPKSSSWRRRLKETYFFQFRY
jgi:hypothetical protein